MFAPGFGCLNLSKHSALWRSFAGFDGRCSLRTWVYRVTHNVAISHVLRQRRKKSQTLVGLEELEGLQDQGESERSVERDHAMGRLWELVQSLKPLDCHVIPSVIQRIGDLLSILGAGYLVYELRLDQVQKKKAGVSAAKMGNAASVDYYRAELQRQRDFHCGIWFWSRLVIFVPGSLVFMVGLQLANPALTIYMCWVEAAFLVFAGLGIPVNLRLARKYQKQIEELDSVKCFT